ncbi:uncharacterized protein LOC116618611 [Nematostella vectensis]|uniref:uncharacterized protein LOC116618611 n=1 Tax=Nematostella vectensis TaxID=45351 RepID=UPI0013906995|nr:uncharacterized protein LOC116618611 [Nematostella vectensis]XP_032238414.1 uncharacterized protein LOC116618611 [Nematostella vectensis]XP_048586404.1 uncharacterized protein LOC116618611 [Nematostella vectensis]
MISLPLLCAVILACVIQGADTCSPSAKKSAMTTIRPTVPLRSLENSQALAQPTTAPVRRKRAKCTKKRHRGANSQPRRSTRTKKRKKHRRCRKFQTRKKNMKNGAHKSSSLRARSRDVTRPPIRLENYPPSGDLRGIDKMTEDGKSLPSNAKESTPNIMTSPNLTLPNMTLPNMTSINMTLANMTLPDRTSTNITSPKMMSANMALTTMTSSYRTSPNMTSTNIALPKMSANITYTKMMSTNVTSQNMTSSNTTSPSMTSVNTTATSITSTNSTLIADSQVRATGYPNTTGSRSPNGTGYPYTPGSKNVTFTSATDVIGSPLFTPQRSKSTSPSGVTAESATGRPQTTDALAATQQLTDSKAIDPCSTWERCSVNHDPYVKAWLSMLPACPCHFARSLYYNSTLYDSLHARYFHWRIVNHRYERLSVYKPTAVQCIRQLLTDKSITVATQQCCYDRMARLITRGSGAGTPNLVAPELNSQLHTLLDLAPYYACQGDWTRYQTVRPPNNALSCRENPPHNEFHRQIQKAREF